MNTDTKVMLVVVAVLAYITIVPEDAVLHDYVFGVYMGDDDNAPDDSGNGNNDGNDAPAPETDTNTCVGQVAPYPDRPDYHFAVDYCHTYHCPAKDNGQPCMCAPDPNQWPPEGISCHCLDSPIYNYQDWPAGTLCSNAVPPWLWAYQQDINSFQMTQLSAFCGQYDCWESQGHCGPSYTQGGWRCACAS